MRYSKMSHSIVQLTAQGKKDIIKRIQKLETKVKELTLSVENAIAKFGMHDEAYHERLELKQMTEAELVELQHLLENSVVLESHANHSTIEIGCTVQLKNGRSKTKYQLVESYEANPIEGKISVQSPLGRSLVGKSLGEIIQINSPAGLSKFEIAAIF